MLTTAEKAQSLAELLTDERRQKIQRVLDTRMGRVHVVLDGIYDEGNVNAVIRTAESFGFFEFHVLKTQKNVKIANRITRGADKWVRMRQYPSVEAFLEWREAFKPELKICVLDAEANTPFEELPHEGDWALVFGNERDGASDLIKSKAAKIVKIPMVGFSQSFNISVAAAITLYEAYRQRRMSGQMTDLSREERDELELEYMIRHMDPKVVEEVLYRKSERV